MDTKALRAGLIASLQSLYDMEVIAPLIEFCQGEMRVLLYLQAHGRKTVNPSALSDALFVTRQRITNVLTALRRKGLVHMQPAEDDRRRIQVRLTASGQNYVAARLRQVEEYLDALIDGLGEHDTQELIRLIERSAGTMEQYGQEAN